MADDLRKLIADGEKLGFTYMGQKVHGGHLQFLHENGKRLTASSTPSSYSSWKQTRKDMERISGRQLPRDNKAGKRSFVKVERMDLRRSEQEIQSAEVIDRLVDRADIIRGEFRHLALSPNNRNAQRARDLLEEFTEIKDELTAHHRIISPIF